MAVNKSIIQKCNYLQVLPRLHKLVPGLLLIHFDLAVGVPIADAVHACLVVHVHHNLLGNLVNDRQAFLLVLSLEGEVVLQACT
jgi:hypothetical protein